jgi:hypothetical protein
MTPDDEALARLRAALHTIADRTPISGGRVDEIAVAAAEKRSRPVVTIVSAAAAVAAIAAVSAVVVGAHSNASRATLPGAGGAESLTPTASPVASPVASAVASPVASLAASAVPSPIPSPVAAGASPSTSCVPENYYVVASPSEVTGLSYMLPATPAGYVLYGAWGTISRNLCVDSVTWYVEYDSTTAPVGTDAIQVTVAKVGGDSLAGNFASARPVASTPITVNGIQGYAFGKDSAYASIGWTTGGAAITLDGPVSGGDIASLVQVADSLVLLSPNDPRIVAPADCQVPAGSVCGGDTATPTPSLSLTPSPSPGTAAAAATAAATATPSAAPTASPDAGWTANPLPSPTPTAG